jgi:acyl dehydratase
VLYRYEADEKKGGASPTQMAGTAPPVGDLPVVSMPVTVGRCVLDTATTRDFFPGHHDREYAHAQGARDVYLNTMFYHGFVDRVVVDWAGPDSRVVHRKLRMVIPACAGDVLTTSGTVAGVRDEGGATVTDVDLVVHTAFGTAAAANITVVGG